MTVVGTDGGYASTMCFKTNFGAVYEYKQIILQLLDNAYYVSLQILYLCRTTSRRRRLCLKFF
jgi:hypothetical protein